MQLRKVISIVCIFIIFCSLLSVLICSSVMSRKISSLYANKDNIEEIAVPDLSFDVNNREETEKILQEVDNIGNAIADLQNKYRVDYLADEETSDENESNQILERLSGYHKEMSEYIAKNSSYRSEWDFVNLHENLKWSFQPVYQYGGQKIPMTWILSRNEENNSDVVLVMSGYYVINQGKVDNLKLSSTYLAQTLMDRSDSPTYAENLIESMKQLDEIAKKENEKLKKSNRPEDTTEAMSQEEYEKQMDIVNQEREKSGKYNLEE